MRSDCSEGVGFPFGVRKVFWSQMEMVAAQHRECAKVIALHALKRLLLCYVDFTNEKINTSCS